LFEFTSNPGEGGIVNFQDTASGYKAALHLSASDELLFYGSTSLLGMGTTILMPGQIYTISAKIGTGTDAAFEIRIDGVVEISGGGNLGTNNNGSILLGGNSTYTTNYYYDDVAINSQDYPSGGGAAAAPTSSSAPPLLTPVQVVNFSPTGTLLSFATVISPPHDRPVMSQSQPVTLSAAGQDSGVTAKGAPGATAALDAIFADWNGDLASILAP
jgi:hypothetical protein